MPPKATNTGAEDDVKFLLAIIKLVGLGATIDFQKVADETGVVSKGAAAKRYSRMPAKYKVGAAVSDEGNDDGTPVAETPSRQKTLSKKGSAKKCKLSKSVVDSDEEAVKAEDDE